MRRFAAGLVIAALGAAHAAEAQSVSTRSQRKLLDTHTKLLDSRAATQYSGSTRLKPPSVHDIPGGNLAYSGKYRGQFLSVARKAARKHGVPEELFLRLVQQESGWNPAARSHKGALGLAQLMPSTARALGVDPFDPQQNLDGGARYLARQFRKFGSWRLALAAYNAGPQAVTRHGGVPPYRETRNYVKAIWGG